MEEEQRSNVINLSLINQVMSQTPCAPPVKYIQIYMVIHNFGRAMVRL